MKILTAFIMIVLLLGGLGVAAEKSQKTWAESAKAFVENEISADSKALDDHLSQLRGLSEEHVDGLRQSGQIGPFGDLRWSLNYFGHLALDGRVILRKHWIWATDTFAEAKLLPSKGWAESARFLLKFQDILWLVLGVFSFLWIKKKTFRLSEKLLQKLLNLSLKEPRLKKISLWYQRLSDYIAWAGIYFLIEALVRLIGLEYVQFTHFLLKILQVVVFFNVLKVFLEKAMFMLWNSLSVRRHTVKDEVVWASKWLSWYYLLIETLNLGSEFVFGRGPLALEISVVTGWLWLPLLGWIGSRWHSCVDPLVNTGALKGLNLVSKRLLSLRGGKFFSLLVWGVFLANALTGRVVEILGRFDMFKSISAKLLSLKIESKAQAEEVEPSNLKSDYVDKFIDFKNWVEISSTLNKSLYQAIDSWLLDKTKENSISIYADKGLGKTTLLKKIREQYGESAKYVALERKIVKAEELRFFIKEIQIEGDEKRIVLLDNAHNLFLSELGGFEAYKELLNVMNETKDSVLWIAAFNLQAWEYLDSVLGRHQFFRLSLKLPKWSETSIRQLIMSCHGQTRYSCRFDEWISVLTNNKGENSDRFDTEEKYYRLLWEKSHGNPGVAKELWLNSLKQVRNRVVEVGPPVDFDFSDILEMQDDSHFVIAAVSRHENLNIEEASLATNLPLPIVKQSIFRGLEEGLFMENSPSRYTISRSWLYPTQKLLKGKNFLYGNE